MLAHEAEQRLADAGDTALRALVHPALRLAAQLGIGPIQQGLAVLAIAATSLSRRTARILFGELGALFGHHQAFALERRALPGDLLGSRCTLGVGLLLDPLGELAVEPFPEPGVDPLVAGGENI